MWASMIRLCAMRVQCVYVYLTASGSAIKHSPPSGTLQAAESTSCLLNSRFTEYCYIKHCVGLQCVGGPVHTVCGWSCLYSVWVALSTLCGGSCPHSVCGVLSTYCVGGPVHTVWGVLSTHCVGGVVCTVCWWPCLTSHSSSVYTEMLFNQVFLQSLCSAKCGLCVLQMTP